MLMKKLLNESAILRRMSREERANIKGGGASNEQPSIVGSLCLQPTVTTLCDCLLAGCGCIPSQRACDRCLAGTEPSDK